MVSPDELMDGRHTRWRCHFVIRIAQIFRELYEMIVWIFYVDSWYGQFGTASRLLRARDIPDRKASRSW